MGKEIPILFSTLMVQAIIDGTKTQTRRVIKLKDGSNPDDESISWWYHEDDNGKITGKTFDKVMDFTKTKRNPHGAYWDECKCPYGKVGDALWVRETWVKACEWDGYFQMPPLETYYKADKRWLQTNRLYENVDCPVSSPKWKPSIHMPKKYARIWLEITDIRVERLQDIGNDDARAEGIARFRDEEGRIRYKDYMADGTVGISVTSYSTLWELINGSDSWIDNPWVWVIEFKILSTTGKPEQL